MPDLPDRDEVRSRLDVAQKEVDQLRGRFLSVMVEIEGLIDRAILYFFAPDESGMFVDLILDRLNADRKLQIFRRIVRELDLGEALAELLKELNALRVERNRLAHHLVHFAKNSFMFDRTEYELFTASGFDRTPPTDADSSFGIDNLEALVTRAQTTLNAVWTLGPQLVEAHTVPKEYFVRPGWDPRGVVGPPIGNPETP